MKQLKDSITEEYELEVWECDCGFHIGLDATYLEQVGEINIACPACAKLIAISWEENHLSKNSSLDVTDALHDIVAEILYSLKIDADSKHLEKDNLISLYEQLPQNIKNIANS